MPPRFLALLLAVLIAFHEENRLLYIHTAKGVAPPPEEFVAWNSFPRVGVVAGERDWNIVIDGDASTTISTLDFDHLTASERSRLTHDSPGVPYLVRPGAKTLVIGPYNVARTLASGSRDITAVEINPIIAQTIMRERYALENHAIYFRPEVRLFALAGEALGRLGERKLWRNVMVIRHNQQSAKPGIQS